MGALQRIGGIAAVVFATSSGAQVFAQGAGYYGYYPPGYWDYGGGAATAQESYARGIADVIRARSQAAVDVARAATEAEQARALYLKNRNYATRSFVENRAIRDEYRKTADNTFYKSKEKLADYVEKRKLKPLTQSEFYESTGEISWPFGLMHPEDAEQRERLQELFTKRAEEGSLTPEEYIEANRLIREWRLELADHRDDFSASDVTDAARFLSRLQMELKGDFE